MGCHDLTDLEAPGNVAAHHATVNPCTLCAPLGAVLAACGIEGTLPLLHGAQGCATYIRRYLISHFREPVDVASSSFSESTTVFGGEDNFSRAIDNIRQTYDPKLIAVGTTCLAETIGEDLHMMISRYHANRKTSLPIVYASTPSYKDGHLEGYHAMVHAIVRTLVAPSTVAPVENCQQSTSSDWGDAGVTAKNVNLLPPIVSPADIRHLRSLVGAFGLTATILPDYSDTLDGPIHDRYHALPDGGTRLSEIAAMDRSAATLDFTLTGTAPKASDALLARGIPSHVLGLPIGIEATDAFIETLAALSSKAVPDALESERGRLLDAYADGHKYVFGKRIGLYGDPEWVVALTRFLLEVGAIPVMCATGARNRALSQELARLPPGSVEVVLEDTDFSAIESSSKRLELDLLIGNSKGYRAARSSAIPLIRLGFPIHDRVGASRILSLGYQGTMALFDALINTLLTQQQERSAIGFSYL